MISNNIYELLKSKYNFVFISLGRTISFTDESIFKFYLTIPSKPLVNVSTLSLEINNLFKLYFIKSSNKLCSLLFK